MARLDRYPEARQVAQLGAVIGREFSRELLAAVSTLPDDRLEAGVRQLLEADLIYPRGRAPRLRYQFKHALVQDTAYQSLLRRRRQVIHDQIAKTLRDKFNETSAIQLDLLAHHLTEAGQTEAAIPLWQQAGEYALERSANAEAVAHLKKGLMLNDSLVENPATMQQELTLLLLLAPALNATVGYGHPEVAKTFERTRELDSVLVDSPEHFAVLFGLWLHYGNVPNYAVSRELAEQLVVEAMRKADDEQILISELALGVSMGWMGECPGSKEQFEDVAAAYRDDQHRALTLKYGGLNPCTFAHAHAGMGCWWAGYPEQALAHCAAGRALAVEIGQTASDVHTLAQTTFVQHNCRDIERTREFAELFRTLAVENQMPYWAAWGNIYLAAANKDVDNLEGAMDTLVAASTRLARTGYLGFLADAYIHHRQVDQALVALTEAIEIAAGGERYYLAELHRLRGESLLLRDGSTADAEECFEYAIDVARQQQSKSWELRAVTSLAQLWKRQGKAREAREKLSDIYNWFTEGFDTKDLVDAKALLDELG
ncbi:MAG: tetratricopeptide (TPR) repeat protein [Gammaproteobacteria bacterium]|jgi:tetratricopeptide (TPR) repeat protein